MKYFLLVILLVMIFPSVTAAELSPDRPLKGKWNFSPQRIWRIDEAAGMPFGEIQALLIPEKKYVVIQDRRQYKLFIVDASTGHLLHAFGERGEGPGQIRRMQGVLAVPGGLLVPERGRLHYFDMKGNFKRSEVISPEIVPRACIDADRIVSAPVLPRDRGDGREDISLYTVSTKETKPIASYQAFKKGTASESSGGNVMTVGIVVGGLTPMMQVHYNRGVIYFGKNDAYRIQAVDLKGHEQLEFGIKDRKRAPVSMKFKRDLFSDLGGDIPQQMLERILNGLPDRCTAWTRMTTDSNGRVYVLGADLERSHAVGVDIFSAAGEFLYQGEFTVATGESIQATAVKDDLLVLAVQDEDGELRVDGFRIQLPPT